MQKWSKCRALAMERGRSLWRRGRALLQSLVAGWGPVCQLWGSLDLSRGAVWSSLDGLRIQRGLHLFVWEPRPRVASQPRGVRRKVDRGPLEWKDRDSRNRRYRPRSRSLRQTRTDTARSCPRHRQRERLQGASMAQVQARNRCNLYHRQRGGKGGHQRKGPRRSASRQDQSLLRQNRLQQVGAAHAAGARQ